MEDRQIVDLYWERSENAINKHPRNMGTHTIFKNTKLNPHYTNIALYQEMTAVAQDCGHFTKYRYIL